MRRILSPTLAFLGAALGHALGADAVGGLHGHNSENFIMRVQNAIQPRMDAIVSATYLAAASLGLESRSAPSSPAWPPTWWPPKATRSTTSPTCAKWPSL